MSDQGWASSSVFTFGTDSPAYSIPLIYSTPLRGNHMSKLTIWLTPIWILAVGVTIGALILLLIWGVTWVVNRRAARSIAEAVGEGILRPISYVVISMAALALLASPSMPVDRIVASLKRLPDGSIFLSRYADVAAC